MDGWITIGTELSTDKFDRQIMQLEKRMKKEENKKIKLEVQIGEKTQDIEEQKRQIEELVNVYDKYRSLQAKADKRQLTSKEFADYQQLAETYGSLEKIIATLDMSEKKLNTSQQQLENIKEKYNDINNLVQEYKQNIENVKLQQQVSQVNKLKNGFKDVGNNVQKSLSSIGSSLGKVVKKAGMIVLSVFGIRRALAMVRQASNELASYDQQYATDIEYIRFVLTQAIAPVLRSIVQMALQLLQIIGAITQALFGVNIFSNGSAENFNKMKASAGGVGKAVKEIKKQLMGFDEVNVLTDQSDTGTAGGGAGAITPSIDVSNIETPLSDIAEKIKKILEPAFNKISEILTNIKTAWDNAWESENGSQIIDNLSNAFSNLGEIVGGVVDTFTEWTASESFQEFANAIVSICVTLSEWFKIITDKLKEIWENGGKETFTKLLEFISKLFTGIDEILKVLTPVIEYIMDVASVVIEAIINVIGDLAQVLGGIIDFIVGVFTGDWDKAWEGIKSIFEGVFNLIFHILEGILKQIELFIKNIIDNIWQGIQDFGKNIVDGAEGLWNDLTSGFSDLGKGIEDTFDGVGKFFENTWKDFKKKGEDAWNGIKSIFSKVGEFFGKTFSDAWNRVVRVFSIGGEIFNNLRDGIVNAFKYIVNRIISGINQVITIPFNAINYTLRTLRNIDIMGLRPFGWVGTINTPQIPYLKTGAIVNMPNKGTLVGGSAFAGESGREGVIPLTDAQAMSELGREIGKNVVLNLTNITTLNGRRINRELKTIQAENDFAFNY